MAQQGQVFKRHGAWFVRYWEKVRQKDGTLKREQPTVRLCSATDYPKKSEVLPLAAEYMARVNKLASSEHAGITIADFVDRVYFSAVTGDLADSTVKGYRDAWRCHLKSRIGNMKIRDFRTVDAAYLMRALGDEHGINLAHATYVHAKVTLSAIFTHAKNVGAYEGANPVTGVKAPKGKRHGRKRLAYTLEEEVQHLKLFTDMPVVQAVIGTAAFAGLREGEIRGLCSEDDEGEILNIRRSVWRTKVKDTKTHEDDEDPGVVPIIRPLRLLLDSVKPKHGWLFPNTIGGTLDLHNLAERVVKPSFRKNGVVWKGWHAYRRGLATNLSELGIPDIVIRAILRHEDVRTTRRYIKSVPRCVTEAMNQLEAQIGCATGVQQPNRTTVLN